MKELLTSSRMSKMLACPRAHYWRYEVGLHKESDSIALRFGSAWHRAMEARWLGEPLDKAFEAGIGACTDLDEVQVATLSGMLAGYYSVYADDPIESMHPEVEFRHPLAGSRKFDVAGKIDGIGVMRDGALAKIEHKSAGEDIGAESDYWLRLRGNPQVMQYVFAARQMGWDVAKVYYDVARKPAIKPLESMPVLDEQGLKVVLDATGNRVIKKDGTPKQTADKDKGEVLQAKAETPDQFGDRLAADCKARPEFYFARREVPVLDDDMAEFEANRLAVSRMILGCKAESRKSKRPEHGWPKNLNGTTCRMCEFCQFCLQNVAVDVAHPPSGFVVGEAHSELNQGCAA